MPAPSAPIPPWPAAGASQPSARGDIPLNRTARLLLALTVVALDAASKAWAVRALRAGATIWIWHPWLGLGLYWNAGAANDLGARHPGVVMAVGIAGTAALVAILLAQRRAGPGVPLMLGGAAGNLLSRLVAGAVPDFIRVYPGRGLFDLADLALQVGAVWLVVAWAGAARPRARAARPRGSWRRRARERGPTGLAPLWPKAGGRPGGRPRRGKH